MFSNQLEKTWFNKLPLRSGWSPLLLAASNGHIDLVKIFLDVNARVDVFDQEARYKHSLVRICLKVGERSDLNISQVGLAPGSWIRECGHLRDVAEQKCLCQQVYGLNFILESCHFFFSKTKAGWTPLHYVAYKGYNELIKALVTKHNAAIDATSMVRTTFLWRVSSCSFRDLLPFPHWVWLLFRAVYRYPHLARSVTLCRGPIGKTVFANQKFP